MIQVMEYTWRKRRIFLYLGVPLLIVFLIFFLLILFLWSNPSCTDGRKNGDEKGIDCEGSCSRVCSERIVPLTVQWAHFEEVRPGFFNIAGVIQNKNTDILAKDVSYTFNIWNGSKVVWTKTGVVAIPPQSERALFEGSVQLAQPQRVTLTINDIGEWNIQKEVIQVVPINSVFSDIETIPKLRVSFKNESVNTLKDVEVVASLVDEKENVRHISKTIIPFFGRRSEESAFFSWPYPFTHETKGVCSNPFSTIIVLDRSGSMNDDSDNPPEPLSSVKQSALDFVNNGSTKGRYGLISFATSASLETSLTSDRETIIQSIKNIHIKPEDEKGYTNIGDALSIAFEELKSASGSKSIILLTDGKPNWPLTPTGIDYALAKRNIIVENDIKLYTIGLGNKIEKETLYSLSSDTSHTYIAPATSDLDLIYEQIALRMCDRDPYKVKVYTAF